MKKMAIALALMAASSFTMAGGCWQGGKYVQCPKHGDTVQQEGSAAL